jgi:hypothetical protein
MRSGTKVTPPVLRQMSINTRLYNLPLSLPSCFPLTLTSPNLYSSANTSAPISPITYAVLCVCAFTTKGQTLRSTTLKPSTPNTLNALFTTASFALVPIVAVHDICHELRRLLLTCSQIASSESLAGPSVLSVRDAKMGARWRRMVSRRPSIKRRRSKGWVRNLGSMSGGVVGSPDRSVIVPFD